MKNPLNKRLLRELREELGKYLVIFLLLTMTIGFVSGFLVADNSMITAYNESFEKQTIEDGHFVLSKEMNRAQAKAIRQMGVSLYELYYVDEPLTNDNTLRIFAQRQAVNRADLMQGRFPESDGEIAIDRMYADNNGLQVGDTISGTEGSWTITGLVALSDYSALFSDNSDSMFDSVRFGVAVVTPEAFSAFPKDDLTWCYAWLYDDPPADEAEEDKMAEELMKQLAGEVKLEQYIPRYQNQAIQFTGEDMGSDRAMMILLLYIIIVIMAFVFSITISNTITKEANVIGTLRASGYTKGELIRHYMTLPILVTLAGALVGNVLGYTVFKDVCVGMYYGSYSLPTYITLWNAEAFWMTTAVPVLLMAVINFGILARKLTLSPLKFLRRDLKRRRNHRALPLSRHIPFFSRFRLRVIFQNVGNYVMLLIGVLFAVLLLMFGLGLPDCLDNYQASIESNLLSNYQYILQIPLSAMDENHKLESTVSMLKFQYEVETDNEGAEPFAAYTLKTLPGLAKSEDVMIYGVDPDSRYIPIQVEADDEVYLSSAYADLGDGYFSGYFSETEITDIDPAYIGTVIDLTALTKVSRQLDVSMGSMMYLVDGFAVVMFMILIYLLSKIIIEKNAQSISLTKILGYTSGEISRLYIVSTSIMVVLFLLMSLPVMYKVLVELFRVMMMQEMTGWIPLNLGRSVFVKIFWMGVGTYAVVAALEYRKIRKVPMDEALKNVE